jgi:hypothetical protein
VTKPEDVADFMKCHGGRVELMKPIPCFVEVDTTKRKAASKFAVKTVGTVCGEAKNDAAASTDLLE